MLSNLKIKIITFFLIIVMIISTISTTVLAIAECDICDDGTCDNCVQNEDCEDCDTDTTHCDTCESSTTCLYPVVSPVGFGTIEMITQGNRLDTLEGKNIALVGGSFNASITHPEIKKCIQEEYPTANIYVLNEIGAGGVYSPKKPSNQSKNFQNKLKELNIDAVVSGNCGCGLCTVKETGSSIAAEYIGIPSVTIGASSFVAEIKSTGNNRGVPVMRTAEYPGAFSSDTKEELQKNAREVLYPQIKEALLKPISSDEIAEGQPTEAPYNDTVYLGCYECIQEYFEMNNWTDGTPIVPPTDQKIKEYLKYTPYTRETATIVSSIAPAYRKCTVYQVAANAIMAGCKEEYMPICIAFARCLADKDFAQTLSSTHAWTPYAWLNGPIARQLGIDSKSISDEDSKSLSKYIELAMLNLAGYSIKDNRMGTYGYLTPWVFAEDEQACLQIGWQPYHTNKGYDLNSNTITAGSALQWGSSINIATEKAEEIKDLIGWDITEKGQNGLGTTNPQVPRTIFVTKKIAKNLVSTYTSKDLFEDALINSSRRPLWFRAYANFWGNTGSIQSVRKTIVDQYNKLLVDEKEKVEDTPTPAWLKNLMPEQDKVTTIATMNKGETPILITGDENSSKAQVIPGGDYVSIEIDLPDNWDILMANKGYKPLSDFYLDENGNQKAVGSNKLDIIPNDCDNCDDGTCDECIKKQECENCDDGTCDDCLKKENCDDCSINTNNCKYEVVSPVGTDNKVIYTGCYDCVQNYFNKNNWTGGTPIVPPTANEVQEYLKYTPYKANDTFGTFTYTNKQCTTYTIAVNAMMAGCPAEYMPICVAYVKCLEDDEWVNTILSKDGWNPYAWLNGPIARQLEIDHCQGMISEENNKRLARFIDLAMLNIVGYDNRVDTFGHISAWTFAEDEEKCVEAGWQPYHVSQGMKMNSNAITASAALSFGNSVTPATDKAEEIMKLMAWDITEKQENSLGTSNGQVNRTLFITEPVAIDLAKTYISKENLEDELVNTAKRPLWFRAYASYMGNTENKGKTLEEVYNALLQDEREKAEETEVPAWFTKLLPNQEKMVTVPTMNKGETAIIVTGDTSRNKFQTMASAGYKTVEIELPSNWDELMAEKGYSKLSTYYLDKPEEPEPVELLLGDIDQNGEITVNDLAQLKLHLIDKQVITEADRLKVADLDKDGSITINDLANLKIMLINQ